MPIFFLPDLGSNFLQGLSVDHAGRSRVNWIMCCFLGKFPSMYYSPHTSTARTLYRICKNLLFIVLFSGKFPPMYYSAHTSTARTLYRICKNLLFIVLFFQVNFPLCTIAHTPRLPEHCIEYVRILLWPKEEPFGGKII